MKSGRLFLVAALTGATVAAFVPTSAVAASCGSGRGFTTVTSLSVGDQYGDRIGGANKGILAVDPSAVCAEIRSALVFVDSNNYVEVGVFEDSSGALEQCQTFDHPHMLVYAHQGNTIKCKQDPPSLTAGQYYHMNVQNTQHNNQFDYYLGSTYEGFYSVNFNKGELQSFDERHNDTDPLHGVFDGLGYMGSAGGWNPWPAVGSVNSVSGWNWCQTAMNSYKVISGSC